jgi:hypothetical protein
VRSWLKAETLYDSRFPSDDARLFVGLVEEAEEEARIGGMVDSSEVRNVLAGHGFS